MNEATTDLGRRLDAVRSGEGAPHLHTGIGHANPHSCDRDTELQNGGERP
jgi:hypothetical protein